MPSTITRLLIIHHHLDFAVTVKRSLEQIGGYEVSPFTSADTGLDYLKRRAHHIALIDFELRGAGGLDVIERVRAVQRDIAIIVTPKNAETMAAVTNYTLQDVIDTPIPVRQFIPILQGAMRAASETLLSDTAEAPAVDVRPLERLVKSTPDSTDRPSQRLSTQPPARPEFAPESPSQKLKPVQTEPTIQKPNFSSLDDVLQDAGTHRETLEVDLSEVSQINSEELFSDSAISAFDQLAAEEPPMPGVKEGGTVRDLRDRLMDSGNRIVIDLLSEEEALNEPQPLPDEDSSGQPNLARKILEGTLDASQPIKPLVEEVAPESQMLKAFDPAAVTSNEAPSTPLELTSDDLDGEGLGNTQRIAQLALDLTQASLESSAEATLLTRDGVMVGHAGRLPADDLEELRLKLEAEAATANPDQPQSASRIKFVHLSGSGKDYMLFTRRMDEADGLALTMVFAGNLPLSVIRRQSDRLVSALASLPEADDNPPPRVQPGAEVDNLPPRVGTGAVPYYDTTLSGDETAPADDLPFDVPLDEAAVADAASAQADEVPLMDSKLMPAYGGPLMPYTYIWLLRDPQVYFNDTLREVLIAGLDSQLRRLGWAIRTLRVHEDFVYLFADVPGERPAGEVVEELKQLSVQLLTNRFPNLNVEDLWAEAYLARYPGRELDNAEVSDFIDFVRETV
jgi:CheY-like chemotaxis protein/REP element-mobilizing transposase RayT